MAQVTDPVMLRFCSALGTSFERRVERLGLFGSRARGDYRLDSDYNAAVFLRGEIGFSRESTLLADWKTSIEVNTGAVIDALSLWEDSHSEPKLFMTKQLFYGVRPGLFTSKIHNFFRRFYQHNYHCATMNVS